MRTDLFCKQTSLNLVIFNKNKGDFKEKKIIQNVKYEFVNAGHEASDLHPRIDY